MPRKPPSEPRKALSLPVIHILVALTDGPRHGYAIKQAVDDRTDGSIRLGPGTLYEAIQRLLDSGLIDETGDSEPANGQEAQRRYYVLTDAGWNVLSEEIARLDAVVSLARSHPKLRKGLA